MKKMFLCQVELENREPIYIVKTEIGKLMFFDNPDKAMQFILADENRNAIVELDEHSNHSITMFKLYTIWCKWKEDNQK